MRDLGQPQRSSQGCTQPRNVDEREMTDVIIIGAGPAGVVAALLRRAGGPYRVVTRDEFGGMAANDGPVGADIGRAATDPGGPAARTIRRPRERTGAGLPQVARACPRVVHDVRAHSAWRETDRFAGCVGVRTSRRRAVRRPAHDRNHDRAAAAGGKMHPLHGRSQPAARRPRSNSPARTATPGPDLGAGVDAGDRRRPTRRGSLRSSALSARGCNSSTAARVFCRRKTMTFRQPSPPRSAARGPCRGELREIESFEKRQAACA